MILIQFYFKNKCLNCELSIQFLALLFKYLTFNTLPLNVKAIIWEETSTIFCLFDNTFYILR